ncbi:MAG: dehydrogenase, partial [Planctomycetaceae bacterium]|nr:dehydrogenase [Planctomycetaceae bacterium]
METKHRLLITDRAWPNCSIERDMLTELGVEIIEAPDQDESTLVSLARDVSAIATCWAPVTEAIVRAAKQCRGIARFGIGLDNIAVDVATELGIPVTNVPDYCVEEVSDHALALMLSCARNVAFYHHRTKQGEYSLKSGPRMRRLAGQVVGLVGLGHIGRRLAAKLHALNPNVWAHTRSGNNHGTGCKMVSLDELLAGSDFVSLHCPLTSDTRHLIDRAALATMKPTATLINTSRGALIDHVALDEALQSEKLAGAALDVFDPEP